MVAATRRLQADSCHNHPVSRAAACGLPAVREVRVSAGAADDHPERVMALPCPPPDLCKERGQRDQKSFGGQIFSRNPRFELVVERGSDSVLTQRRRDPADRPEVSSDRHADVAQLVEHHLAKVRVAGSNPVVRSVARLRVDSDPREAARRPSKLAPRRSGRVA